MSLPKEYTKEEEIRIYHYVEELVLNYTNYITPYLEKENITLTECPLLLRLRFTKTTNQGELAKEFHLTEGHTSKLFKGFEEKGLIKRVENPENRRKKIVTFTEKGTQLTDKLIKQIDIWEEKNLKKLEKNERTELKKLLYKLI